MGTLTANTIASLNISLVIPSLFPHISIIMVIKFVLHGFNRTLIAIRVHRKTFSPIAFLSLAKAHSSSSLEQLS
uniref:Uncharacterized protein n=1 Tax=Parascaris univalens TaxID=6257 RepID=A0A915BNI9_PARUN